MRLHKPLLADQYQEQDAPAGPDIYGIGVSPCFGSQFSQLDAHISKRLRRDSWASRLQVEGVVKASYDPLIQDMVIHPTKTAVRQVQSPQSSEESSTPRSLDCGITAPVGNFRVPSPLLYHRRSNAAYSNAYGIDQDDKSLRFTHTRLMSEIRRKSQQLKRKNPVNRQDSGFDAAKLPLMGSFASPEKPISEDITLPSCPSTQRDSVERSLPPILTTTNMYLCPQKLYQLCRCPSGLALSKGHDRSTTVRCLPNQSLIVPSLIVSGQFLARKPDHQDLAVVATVASNQPGQSVNIDTIPANCLESRDRSSTQSSLDRNFTVAGAVPTVPSTRHIAVGETATWSTPAACLNQNSLSGPSDQPSKETILDLTPNKGSHSAPSRASRDTVVIGNVRGEAMINDDNEVSPKPDYGILQAVEVSKDDAESSNDEWNWADDQWQSDGTTPQSMDGSQIGLCAANWV